MPAPGLIAMLLMGLANAGLNTKANKDAGFEGTDMLFASDEQRKEKLKANTELRKEDMKTATTTLDKLRESGDVEGMQNFIPYMLQKKYIDQATAEANLGMAKKNKAQMDMPMQFIQSLFGAALGQGQGQTGQQGASQGQSPKTPGFSNPQGSAIVQPQSGSSVTGLPDSIEKVPYIDLFKKYSQQYNVPLPVALALGHAESEGFKADAKSPTGVVGVMQVTKGTMKRNGFDPAVHDRTNPEVSIHSGIKELARLRDQDGVDLNNIQQVVMGYTTPEGGATPKYVKKVADRYNHFNTIAGEGGQSAQQSPFPLVQRFPDMNNMPPMQQFVLDNVARTLQISINPQGKMDLKFNPFAAPSVDEQTATLLSSMPVDQRNAILMGALAAKAGKQEIREMKVDENTGWLNMHTFNPVDQTSKVVPLWKTGQTPMEKANLEVETAGRKETVGVVGKEKGLQQVQSGTAGLPQTQAQRENTKLQETLKSPDDKFVLDLGDVVGISGRIEDGFEVIKQFAGLDSTGKLNTDNVPTGPFEALSQKFQKVGIGDEDTGIVRERLTALSSDVVSLMYAISGKQVSDKEQEKLEALNQAINLSPHIYLTRMVDVLDMIERKAQGKQQVMKAANQDTRAVDEAIKHVGTLRSNVFSSLPEKYEKLLRPKKGKTGNDATINARKLYETLEGGK